MALPTTRTPDRTAPAPPGTIGYAHETYLRVVANPFLAIAGFLGWIALLMRVGRLGLPLSGPATPALVLAFGGSLVLLARLMHFHCLDCGATGRLSRWRKHACPAAVARWDEGRPRRWRGPSPAVQVVLWLWILLLLVGAYLST